MRTQKLLVLLSTAALIGGGSLQAQSSNSGAASLVPQHPSHLTPEAEAKLREELHRQMAILNAQDAGHPGSPAAGEAGKAKMSPGWSGGTFKQPEPYGLGTIPPGSLSPEARQRLLDALHKAEAELDAQDGVPGDKLSPEDERKARETLHQAEADLNARDKAAADRKAQAELTAKQAREAQLAADRKAAADKAAADMAAKKQKESELTAEQRAAADKAAAELAAKQKAEAERAALRQSLAKQQNVNSAGLYTPSASIMVPGSKEQRLYDLLQLYKADKISPAEYHQQRAKIVAEP